VEITGDYWRILEITGEYCRGYWRILETTGTTSIGLQIANPPFLPFLSNNVLKPSLEHV